MRAIFVAVVVVILGGLGGATYSNVSAAGPKNFAVGGGDQVYSSGEKHFAISAHDGPNGPSGYVVFTQEDVIYGDFSLQGHVTCVAVSGNSATIGVGIEHGSGTAAGQSAIYIVVQDNGGSGAADSFNNSNYVADASSCFAPFDPVTPITSGNINVK